MEFHKLYEKTSRFLFVTRSGELKGGLPFNFLLIFDNESISCFSVH